MKFEAKYIERHSKKMTFAFVQLNLIRFLQNLVELGIYILASKSEKVVARSHLDYPFKAKKGSVSLELQ